MMTPETALRRANIAKWTTLFFWLNYLLFDILENEHLISALLREAGCSLSVIGICCSAFIALYLYKKNEKTAGIAQYISDALKMLSIPFVIAIIGLIISFVVISFVLRVS